MKHLIWILIIIFMPLIKGNAQLIADFSANLTESCDSTSVTFFNNSIPSSGLSYSWDFGNGQTSVLENPTMVYTQKGFYTVILVISDGINQDTIIKPDFIKIWNPPVSDFTIVENITGCAPLNTKFQNLSTPGDGSNLTYQWDFGDGQLGTEINPIHQYNFQSNYTVSLTVTDENGCASSYTSDDVVSVFKPTASFNSDFFPDCRSEADVNFNNMSEGLGNLLYSWDFGDSDISNDETPLHHYFENGTYDVSLVVTDEHSCKDTMLRKNFIKIEGVHASFELSSDTLCVDEVLSLNNTSENAYSFLWDFDDGATSEQRNPTHSFLSPGTYQIKLIAQHIYGCTDTIQKSVYVENLSADFKTSDRYSCKLPIIIQYTNLSQNAVSYEWHFGNGEISYDKNPELMYSKQGIYSDTLIVYSPHGCKAEKVLDSSFIVKLPRAYFTPNQWSDPWSIKGCVPLTINFKDKSNYNNQYDSIKTCYWTFGNGSVSNDLNPQIIYSDTGKFYVNYYFGTERGCISSNYYSLIKVGTEQKANFYMNLPDTICASQPVQFFDNSQDTTLIDEWYWRFGDGEYSMKKNPVHMYKDTGSMDVKLQVYYNGCGVAELKPNFVYVKGPVVNPSYETYCNNPYKAFLSSNAKDAEKIYWDFGDGSGIDSVNFNPEHIYPDNMSFFAKLTAVNKNTGCNYYSETEVKIKDIQAYFTIDTLFGCEDLKVNLNSENSQDASSFLYNNTNAKYYWDFGDGNIIHTNSDQVSHSYKNKGEYFLKLLVKDFRGCSDSTETKIKIYKPEPDFDIENISGCLPRTVQFKNLTLSDTLVKKWSWNFNDGNYSYIENPVHMFEKIGQYDIALNATDTLGCTSDTVKINFIKVIRPFPDFNADNPNHCFGDTVSFFPLDTTLNIVSYLWDFGDGYSSNEKFPKHLYDNEGEYNVGLYLIDKFGCDSSLFINNYISTENYPVPNFNSTDSMSECYPLSVNFYDDSQSSKIVDWQWDFGDGKTSSHLKNPEHIYTSPGLYDVSLNVITSNGCSAQINKNNYIDLRGPYAEYTIPDTVCKGEELNFVAKNKRNVYDLEWVFGDGANSYNDSVTHIYGISGKIKPVLLLRSDSVGTCDILLEDSLYIPALNADIHIPNNQTGGCTPFTVNFYNNNQDATSRFWDFGDNTYSVNTFTMHTYTLPGIYNVKLTVQNDFGCIDTSIIQVESYAAPDVQAMTDTFVCLGDEIQLNAAGALSYKWLPKKWLLQPDSDTPFAKPDSTIIYNVTGTDVYGCVNNSSVKIKVQQIPEVNLKDTVVIIGESVNFNVYSDEIADYHWFPDYEIDCTDCSSVSVIPLEPVTYSVTVGDTAGCFDVTYDVNIDIMRKYTVDVPEAFTPNGDGINDILYVRGWGIDELVQFKIFNRFGELVFSTNDKNEGWDGTYKGNKQGVETFKYLVTVKTYDNTFITKRGTVKLIK